MEFGKRLKLEEFHLDPDAIYINHGSYGAVPKKVLQEQFRLKELTERHPDDFYKRRSPRLWRECLELICPIVGTSIENTVFVENASFGSHSCLFSIDLGPEDAVLVTNFTFHAVKKLVATRGCKVIQLQINFPIESDEQIVELYRDILTSEKNIKVAMLDHVTSPTAVVLPVKKIAEVCRDHGVITIVDGAHGLVQTELNVEEIGVDFYTGNLHKWFYTPRGSAFMWVSPKYQNIVRPGVVSHFHGNSLHFDFCVRGTRDDTPYYTLPAVINFCNQFGGIAGIRSYMKALLDEAAEMLMSSWGTEKLTIPRHMEPSGMRVIKLPEMPNYPKTSVGLSEIDMDLYNQFNIQSFCIFIQGECYVRLSANVYNCMEDYEQLNKAILHLRDAPPKERSSFGYDLPVMHWDLSPLIIDQTKTK